MASFLSTYKEKYFPDKQSQGYAGMLASLIWIGALVLLVLLPAFRDINKIRVEMVAASQNEKAVARNVEIIEQARRNLAAEEENVQMLGAAIPEDPRVVTFVNEVNTVLESFNLQKEAFDYDGRSTLGETSGVAATLAAPTEARVTFGSLTFNITAVGSYTDISNFVDRLESLPRLAQIDTIQVEQVKESDTETGQQKVILSGKFFFEK